MKSMKVSPARANVGPGSQSSKKTGVPTSFKVQFLQRPGRFLPIRRNDAQRASVVYDKWYDAALPSRNSSTSYSIQLDEEA